VTAWTGESLRRAALDALGSSGSQLARDAIVRCAIDLVPAVATWEASPGRVQGHRVALALDSALLERIRRDPSIYDAICAAFAAAVATRARESLFELELHPLAGGMETPYRGRRR
jgi:hypothetical protein